MKQKKYIAAFLFGLISLSSCSDWLEQENLNATSEVEIYSSDAGITSLASNFYSRMKYWQDFATDNLSYDLSRWDESFDTSQYAGNSGNVGGGYRDWYDYGLIRELNLHIENLKKISVDNITEKNYKYYLSEARFLRAFVYFRMVVQYGGVPLITEVTQYPEDPLTLAKPRDKESRIYDFIAEELDDAMEGLADSNSKTRVTKGAAQALKCRAMLYAGTLAYNHDKSAAMKLNLESGATGIGKELAVGYLEKCLDAVTELEKLGYSLYTKGLSKGDYAENYYAVFTSSYQDNPEIIFGKAYDGKLVKNNFTMWHLPRTQAVVTKTGAQANPVLNLVNDYEVLATRTNEELDAYQGDEMIESINEESSRKCKYNVYDNADDIFKGRDPRLAGTVLYPGSSFRGKPVDLQAGLAVLQPDGSYIFKSATTISEINSGVSFNGERLTGEDGPLRKGTDADTYICQTGFMLKKYVDSNPGSEVNGASTLAYIVFRFGEALLNGAEAAYYLNRLGIASYNNKSTSDLALSYINQIRRRAAGEDFQITPSELTFERIVNERRVELAFEDHRYYDLKRWRMADEIWHYDENSVTANIFVLWPYKIYAPGDARDGKWIYRKMKSDRRGSISFTDKMYYNTYPKDDGNPNIEKNPS